MRLCHDSFTWRITSENIPWNSNTRPFFFFIPLFHFIGYIHLTVSLPPYSNVTLRFQNTSAMELGLKTALPIWWLVPTSDVTALFTARLPRRQEAVNSRWQAISLPVRGPLIAIQSRGKLTSRHTVSIVNSENNGAWITSTLLSH